MVRQNLKKKFCLLLAATPIQNKVEEIFHLVSLLKPGHLGNASLFSEKYKGKGRNITEDEHLKELVNTVMIRNRRADTGIEWTKRHGDHHHSNFLQPEQALYDAVSKFKPISDGSKGSAFSALTLQREACRQQRGCLLYIKEYEG